MMQAARLQEGRMQHVTLTAQPMASNSLQHFLQTREPHRQRARLGRAPPGTRARRLGRTIALAQQPRRQRLWLLTRPRPAAR
jgi:hypothetical protein